MFIQHIILYTSDIHGNEFQYEKLVEYAIEISADSVVIGGDLAPKNFNNVDSYINGQRHFLDKRLPKFLAPIRKKLPDSRIFLMMGNDDCAVNLDVLKMMDPKLFELIHAKRIKLAGGFDIVGYSYVPITPFGIKDWEKYDLSQVPINLQEEYKNRKKRDYELSGFKTTKFGLQKFQFTPKMENEDSIQKDLSDSLFYRNADNTVYVFHTPPYKTNLDQLYSGGNVGSMAVRLFIENHQPHLTLHGHVHETVEKSGDYKQNIGKTLCLTSGNDDFVYELAVLVLDLYDPSNVKREII